MKLLDADLCVCGKSRHQGLCAAKRGQVRDVVGPTVAEIKAAYADRDARWWSVTHALLLKGPASTREIIDAVGRANSREGAQIGNWVHSRAATGAIVRAGERLGPTGHRNIVWALPS
jgi:hypothetical protein